MKNLTNIYNIPKRRKSLGQINNVLKKLPMNSPPIYKEVLRLRITREFLKKYLKLSGPPDKTTITILTTGREDKPVFM
jgi:hypothetical protein